MARVLSATVHVYQEDGTVMVLSPGDVVPDWAKSQVSNPAAFVDDGTNEREADTAPSSDSVPESREPYGDRKHSDLQVALKSRDLSAQGDKATLIARLEADDRERYAALEAEENKAAADRVATTAQLKE